MSNDAVAAAVAAVEALTVAERRRFLDALCGHPAVTAAGFRVSERRLCVERFAVRNAAIRAARARGLSYGQLAGRFGMTRYAIRNVVKRGKCEC